MAVRGGREEDDLKKKLQKVADYEADISGGQGKIADTKSYLKTQPWVTKCKTFDTMPLSILSDFLQAVLSVASSPVS